MPEYMLKMKKATRQEKRYLAKHAVNRQTISRESKYDREKRERLQQSIKKTKRMKLEGGDENKVQNNLSTDSDGDQPQQTSVERPKKKKIVKSGKLGFKTATAPTKANRKTKLKKKKVKSAEASDI